MTRGARGNIGKYRLVARLARGGQAEVFLALLQGAHNVTKFVVVKRLLVDEILGDNSENSEAIQMFIDEARLASRLAHPNVVHTYEIGEDVDRTPFIVMEYLDGVPLSKLMRHDSREQITQPIWAWIASEALKGLAYAHDLADYDGTPLQIVHRDVSPQNIVVTYTAEVKLLDFGIAKALRNVNVTRTGVLKGKIRYMAPEQLVDRQADRRADLFAMGVVLWEALAGHRLFQGDDVQVARQILADPVPRAANARRDVDPDLGAVIDRALAKDPDARFQTAQEMRDALEAYLATRGPRREDIADLVREMFRTTREQVQEHLRVVAEEQSVSGFTPPSVQSLPLLLNPTVPSVAPSHGSAPPKASSPTAINASTSISPNTQSALARRVLWPAILACVVGLGSVGVIAARRLSRARHAPAHSDAPVASSSWVVLDSVPDGASVLRDGEPVGVTPLRVPTGHRSTKFELTKDGFAPFTAQIDVAPGETRSEVVYLVTAAPTQPPPTLAPDPPPAPAPTPTRRATRASSPTASAPTHRAEPTPSLHADPPKPSVKVIEDGPRRSIKVLD